MPDTALSALPAASAPDADDVLYLVEDGVSVKLTLAQLATFLATSAVGLPGFRFRFDSGTSSGDPGAGYVRFNNATLAFITETYLDDVTVDGVDLSTLLASLGSSGFLKFTSLTDPAEWVSLKWTATPTDNTGSWTFTVVYQGGTGSFEDEDELQLSLVQLGAPGGSTQGRHAVFIDAGSMAPSATGGCAPLSRIATSANHPDIATLDHDPTTQEYHQFKWVAPKSWNQGPITAAPVWRHAATTTNFGVAFSLQAVATRNDDTIDAAFGTEQVSVDTGGTTSDFYMGPETSAITVAGTLGNEVGIWFRGSRVTGNGGDNMGIDAGLIGWVVYFTTNADTDA